VRRLKQLAWVLLVTAPSMAVAGFGVVWLKGLVEAQFHMRVPGFLSLCIQVAAIWGAFWLTAGRIIEDMKAHR